MVSRSRDDFLLNVATNIAIICKIFKLKNNNFFILITSILSILFIEYIYTKGLVFETDALNGFFYGKYISDTLFYNAPFGFF